MAVDGAKAAAEVAARAAATRENFMLTITEKRRGSIRVVAVGEHDVSQFFLSNTRYSRYHRNTYVYRPVAIRTGRLGYLQASRANPSAYGP